MVDLTDRNYILNSLIEVVRDENIRIMSQKLATPDEVHKLADVIRSGILERQVRPTKDEVIEALSFVYDNLAAVKLPGDFEKIACGVQDAFCIVLDVPVKNEVAEVALPQEGVLVLEPEKKEDKKEEEKEKKEKKIKKVKAMILERLEKIAYALGSSGDHEAAYTIERTMQELEATAAEGDMFNEMNQMENQRRNPPAQYSYPPDSQLFGKYQQYAQPQGQQKPQAQAPQAQKPQQSVQQQQQRPVQHAQPNPQLKQMWDSLSPQQKQMYTQLHKQRPMEKPEHLIEMVKQQTK